MEVPELVHDYDLRRDLEIAIITFATVNIPLIQRPSWRILIQTADLAS